jgi:CRP/FNR family cyclic AMP-dependent transcriptional regulator
VTSSIRDLLADQRLFREFDENDLALFAGCGRNQVFHAGTYLANEGDDANWIFVVRSGRVAIELHAPGGPLVIDTLGEGDVVGWSWIFPPYHWVYDVEALDTAHVVCIDGACLRAKCEADPAFGYRVMQRFAQVILQRLQATRLRLLDLYGTSG